MPLYLDTHFVIFLYMGAKQRMSARALELIESEEIRISPMVFLELQYLYDIGRLTQPPEKVVGYLEARIDLRQCNIPFPRVVQFAAKESWTRDPFDRIIVAQARLGEHRLLSRDESILQNYNRALA
jgi:PIN domain nuclease of toxin-antitoxin system